MSEDDFVPDTPSPVFVKNRKLFSSDISNRVLKNSGISNGAKAFKTHRMPLSLPGQVDFQEERLKAIKRKKKREHLSPFKSKSDASMEKKRKCHSPDEVKVNNVRKNTIRWPSSSDSSSDDDDDRFTSKVYTGAAGCSKGTVSTSRATGAAACTSPCAYSNGHVRNKLESKHNKILQNEKLGMSQSTTHCKTKHNMVEKEKRNVLHNKKHCKSKHMGNNVLEKELGMVKSKTHCKSSKPRLVSSKVFESVGKKTSSHQEESSSKPWHNYMAESAGSPRVSVTMTPSPDKSRQPLSSIEAWRDETSCDYVPTSSSFVLPGVPPGYVTPKKSPRRAHAGAHARNRQQSSSSDVQITGEDADVICISPDDHHDQSIDVETFTPETRKAYSHIRQMQKDEEVARKLQEQMDMEFAMTLQNQSEQESEPSTLTEQELEESEPGFIIPPDSSPPRTRARRRGRGVGMGQRFTRASDETPFMLMNLIGDHVADMDYLLGMTSRWEARRRGARYHSPQLMAGLMASPSDTGNDYEYLMDLAETIGDAKPKGLSKSQSNQLPLVTYKKQEGKTEECNICMTEYDDGDSQKILPCFHTYHSRCIDKWISKNATCPVCRVPVKLE